MSGSRPFGPIYSSRVEEAGVSEALDEFVIALAHRIDELQDIELGGKIDALAAQAGPLAFEAANLGYEALAQTAQAVEAASHAGDAEEARKQLIQLTELSQRVRLGHRGALG